VKNSQSKHHQRDQNCAKANIKWNKKKPVVGAENFSPANGSEGIKQAEKQNRNTKIGKVVGHNGMNIQGKGWFLSRKLAMTSGHAFILFVNTGNPEQRPEYPREQRRCHFVAANIENVQHRSDTNHAIDKEQKIHQICHRKTSLEKFRRKDQLCAIAVRETRKITELGLKKSG
jgi:hypothetical protein